MTTNNKTVAAQTKFRPLGNRLIVKRPGKESISAGGITLVTSAQEETTQGTVLAIGPGLYDNKTGELTPITGIVVGDTVLFGKKAGEVIKTEGEEVLFLRQGEVMAVASG